MDRPVARAPARGPARRGAAIVSVRAERRSRMAYAWREACVLRGVGQLAPNLLLCDEDRDHTDSLAAELGRRGHGITVARSCADAFAAACALDFDAMILAPYLRDGSALVL